MPHVAIWLEIKYSSQRLGRWEGFHRKKRMRPQLKSKQHHSFLDWTYWCFGRSPSSHRSELLKAVEESPLYTLLTMIRQQLLGFPAYLILNTSGQKHYPANTNREPTSTTALLERYCWSDRFQPQCSPLQTRSLLAGYRFKPWDSYQYRHLVLLGIQAVILGNGIDVSNFIPMG